jgi:hypothetical protein
MTLRDLVRETVFTVKKEARSIPYTIKRFNERRKANLAIQEKQIVKDQKKVNRYAQLNKNAESMKARINHAAERENRFSLGNGSVFNYELPKTKEVKQSKTKDIYKLGKFKW